MRIEKFNAKSFLGLSLLSIDLPQGLSFIVGQNGTGKTSLLDGIRFALTGEKLRGAKLKSDLSSLIRQGAKEGSVAVVVDGQKYTRSLKTGESNIAVPLPEAAPYVLDAQRFGALTLEDRRRFLFDLMQVETSHTAVAELLRKAEVRTDVIDEVLPLLRGGFEGAEKYATNKTAEARGAWKQVTSEVYGDKKAEGWQPKEAPLLDGESDEALTKRSASLSDAESKLTGATKELGAAEARTKAANNPDLDKARTNLPQWLAKQKIGRDRETALVAEIEALKAKASEAGGVYQPCPACGVCLLMDHGVLKEAKAPGGDQIQAGADLVDARAELDTVREALKKIDNNIRIAQGLIADAEGAGGDPAELAAKVKQLEGDLGRARLARSTLDIREKERELFGAKTREAQKHHEDVQAWKLCTDQLSPSGIPAALLAQALYPLNMQLGAASDLTEWSRVTINPDMTITYGTILYALCSKSERWRCDAMIADALARLSGVKVLLLDEFDILDSAGRSTAMQWLIAIAPEYDTLIVAATLKALPAIEGVNAIWLDEAATGRKAA